MNDYERRLEEARRARMQGVRPRTDGVVPPRAPQKNRIEEVLGRAAYVPENVPVVPPLAEKKREEVVISAPAAEPRKSGNAYGRFLKRFFGGLFIIVLLFAVTLGGYVAFKNYTTPKIATTQQVIETVGKLVSLPQNETPTVATVSDLKPLAGQPFFKDAQVGDKVLIYATSSKAILYRPSTNKVINVAPLNQ